MVAFNIFILAAVCSIVGFNFGAAFGWPCWTKILCVLSVCILCFFWFVGGVVTGLKQIHTCPITYTENGSSEVKIRFMFGPFKYEHVVPEDKNESN